MYFSFYAVASPIPPTSYRSIILDAMEAMSQSLMAAAGLDMPHPAALEEVSSTLVPPLPLDISITGCNVAPPSDRCAAGEGVGGDARDQPEGGV